MKARVASPLAALENFLLALIAPHSSIQSPVAYRQAQLNAAISLSFSLIIFFGTLVSFLITGSLTPLFVAALLFALLAFVAYLLSRSPRFELAAWVLLLGFLGLAYFASFTSQYLALFLVVSFSVLYVLTNLIPLRSMFWLILFNTLILVVSTTLFAPNLAAIERLNVLAGVFTLGLFILLFAWHRNNLERLRLDEIRQSQAVIEERNRQLEMAQSQLQKRFAEIQLAAEVGRAVSQVRALADLLRDAVERIRARFDLYYVQVYLVNPSRTHLVLEAGTGEVGLALRARRHQLLLNSASINGRAATEKKAVVIPDTARSSFFRPNPLLPRTRAEMAVPLIIGDEVIGVLDMQSEQVGGLTEEMLPAFEALAGQLAIAIQNARLLEEAEKARQEAEKYARRLERQGWQEFLDGIRYPEQLGYLFEQEQVLPLEDAAAPMESPDALQVPIQVSGETIGMLTVELEESARTPQAMELLHAVSRQLAEHLDNLRLLQVAEYYRTRAEEAARRLTREGWQEYLRARAAQPLGFFYDTKKVLPFAEAPLPETEMALSVPLRVRNEVIGQVAVLDADVIQDRHVRELIDQVTERLSSHLETLRLLEETRRGQLELDRRARQLQAVAEVSTTASREQEIQSLLKSVARLTRQQFNLYHCRIYLYEARHEMLRAVAFGWTEDMDQDLVDETVIPLAQEQSLVARAARTHQPVVVNDVYADPGWLPNPLLPHTRAELAVPLLVGDTLLGVLDIQSTQTNAFSQEDINIQMTLAAQIATALQNAQNYERARRQAEREALLNAISQKIQSATTVEAVLQIAARELGHALKAPRTIVQLSLKES